MNLTAWILLGAVGLLIGWDIIAVAKWGYTSTISYDVMVASKGRPIIAFALGVVIGHILWAQ